MHADLMTAITVARRRSLAFLAVSLPVSPLARMARNAGAAPAFYTFLSPAIGSHNKLPSSESGSTIALGRDAGMRGGPITCGPGHGAVRIRPQPRLCRRDAYPLETLGRFLGIRVLLILRIFWSPVWPGLVRMESRYYHGTAGGTPMNPLFDAGAGPLTLCQACHGSPR